MAVETIPKANVSAAQASAPASAPAAETPRAPATPPPASDTDSREPRRPKVDLCWPPPIALGLPGIAQIRPICYHFQRFGGPEKD